jgi:hypothetical protein
MEETEKQFIDLVSHVFTLDWIVLAMPIALALSMLANRVLVGLALALVAVLAHHAIMEAIPLMQAGQLSTLPAALVDAVKTAEPLSLLAEFCGYAFLIVVFSLTRQDMARPFVSD